MAYKSNVVIKKDKTGETPPPAPETPAVPAAVDTPTTTLTPEEMDKRLDTVMLALGGSRSRRVETPPETTTPPTPSPTQKPDEKKKDEVKDDKAKPGDKKAETPAEPPKETPAPTPPEAPDLADQIEQGFNRVASRLSQKPVTPPAPPAIQPKNNETQLSKQDQRRISVLELMAKENPETYAGHPAAYKKFLEGEKGYIATWQKENPGKPFNGDDEEHDEFYEKNRPTWDEDDYIESLATLRADERTGAALKKEEEKRTFQQTAERSLKVATKSGDEAALSLRGAVADEIKDVAHIGIISEIVKSETDFIRDAMKETELMFGSAIVKFDPQNSMHRWLYAQMEEYEKKIAELPPKTQQWKSRDGRTLKFATLSEYADMPVENRKDYWTLFMHPSQIRPMLMKTFTERLRGKITKFKQDIGKVAGDSAQKPPDKPTETPTQKPPESRPAPRSPSLGGGVRTDTAVTGKTTEEDKKYEYMDRALSGG